MVDWKKEIKLGKRTGEQEAAPADATPADEKVTFWKKEIGGRKRPPAEAPVPESSMPAEKVPFWKKEIGRKKRAAPVEAAAPEPVALAPVEHEPAPVEEPAPRVDELPAEEVVPELDPAAAAQAAGYGWLTAGLEQETTELRSWAETTLAEIEAELEAEATAMQPVAELAPAPVGTAPVDTAPVDTAPVDTVTVARDAVAVVPDPSFVAPAPAPGIHPPVPASELPPLPAETAEPKVPFWKRDLSFGGKKDAQPKAAKAPKPPKAKREKKPKEPKAEKPRKATEPPRPEKTRKAPKPKRERGAKSAGRQKQLVGLKIGGSQLAAAHVRNNGHVEVAQLAREPLEAGIVVGGELRDPEALAQALKAFFSQHKLPKRNVRLGIANNRIGVRTLDVVGIDDPKQLANAIRFRAQEALPIPIEDAVLDYQVLSEGTNEAGDSVRKVLLVVAYRELVDRYVDACRSAGLKLAGIDLEAFALLRALSEPRAADAADGSALVAVSIGHDRTTFAVSDGRTCEFTRVLDWGGFALSVAVARALDVAPSEAEPVKRQLSLHGAEIVDGLAPDQAEAAREAMRKQVHTFARELVSSLQFYQGQPGSLPIGSITLTGGTAHLTGLAEELQRLIGVAVVVGDPLTRVELGKKAREEEQIGSMAIAIGLGIDD